MNGSNLVCLTQRPTYLAVLFLVLSQLAFGKRVEDQTRSFSIEIPDSWKLQRPGRHQPPGAYGSPDGKAILSISTYQVHGSSLAAWARSVADGLLPQVTRIYDDRLGDFPAKRLERMNAGALTVTWMAKKGQSGAGIALLYPLRRSQSYLEVRQQLCRSFRWSK